MSDDEHYERDERPAYDPGPARETRRRSRSARTGRASERSSLNPRAPRAPRAVRETRPVRPTRSPHRRSDSGAIAGARIAVPAIILLLIVGGIAFGVWSTFYRAASNMRPGQTVTVVIPEGASASQVASELAKEGIVKNATMFRIRANALGAADRLKPGEYELVTGSSYDSVIKALVEGPKVTTVTFTIPEGWGIEAISKRVEAKFGIPAREFADLAETGKSEFDYDFLKDNPTKSLEGYLFPKTYTLEASATASDIINVMLAQYGKEIADLDYSCAASKRLTPHDVLTMASIIEREAVLDKDRPKVASVIYNRLKIGMRLQLDSTVQYALNGKAKLNLDDLKYDSPYNTYVYAGLPPGPICNPGITSIKAALAPAKTNYIYYILTHKDGSQSFTSSYSEFLTMKNYLKQHGLK